MAQTKTRGSRKRSSSASTRSRSQARKPQSSPRSRSTKQKQARSKQARSRPTKQSKQSSNQVSSASNGLGDLPQGIEKTGKKVARNVGEAASKAKTPLLAGSAALAGAAGGMAIGAMRSRHSARKLASKPLRRGRVKVNSQNVAKAARRIGTVSQHVADLTGEMNGGQRATGKRKSPVEVVLEGLTARR